ncbi:hypothetical protein ACLOJK_026732 [Asimina triloba]
MWEPIPTDAVPVYAGGSGPHQSSHPGYFCHNLILASSGWAPLAPSAGPAQLSVSTSRRLLPCPSLSFPYPPAPHAFLLFYQFSLSSSFLLVLVCHSQPDVLLRLLLPSMLAPSSSSSMETPDERRSMRNRRLSFHSKSPSRVFFVFFFHQRRLGFKAKTEPGEARLGSFFCFFLPYSLISSFRRLKSSYMCVKSRFNAMQVSYFPMLTLQTLQHEGMLFLERPYQGPGLAQMVNISESYLALVAEVGDIPPAQSVELKDLDQTVHNVMERCIEFATSFCSDF